MSDKNKKDTPDVRGAFHGNDNNRTNHGPNSKPCTTGELERLEAERRANKPHLDYTIGGSIEKNVHQQIDQGREKRIRTIKKHLSRKRGKARDGFSRSR